MLWIGLRNTKIPVLPNLTIMNTRVSEVISVEFLGYNENVTWKIMGMVFMLLFQKKPCDAYALKIGFANPIK